MVKGFIRQNINLIFTVLICINLVSKYGLL